MKKLFTQKINLSKTAIVTSVLLVAGVGVAIAAPGSTIAPLIHRSGGEQFANSLKTSTETTGASLVVSAGDSLAVIEAPDRSITSVTAATSIAGQTFIGDDVLSDSDPIGGEVYSFADTSIQSYLQGLNVAGTVSAENLAHRQIEPPVSSNLCVDSAGVLQRCGEDTAEIYTWVENGWSGCAAPISGTSTETQIVSCQDSAGNIVDVALCNPDEKPATTRSCEAPASEPVACTDGLLYSCTYSVDTGSFGTNVQREAASAQECQQIRDADVQRSPENTYGQITFNGPDQGGQSVGERVCGAQQAPSCRGEFPDPNATACTVHLTVRQGFVAGPEVIGGGSTTTYQDRSFSQNYNLESCAPDEYGSVVDRVRRQFNEDNTQAGAPYIIDISATFHDVGQLSCSTLSSESECDTYSSCRWN